MGLLQRPASAAISAGGASECGLIAVEVLRYKSNVVWKKFYISIWFYYEYKYSIIYLMRILDIGVATG
jgi:hypothetical protein